jgi:hypothetical protein
MRIYDASGRWIVITTFLYRFAGGVVPAVPRRLDWSPVAAWRSCCCRSRVFGGAGQRVSIKVFQLDNCSKSNGGLPRVSNPSLDLLGDDGEDEAEKRGMETGRGWRRRGRKRAN